MTDPNLTIPHAIFMNRNLIAMVIDVLVEEGALSDAGRQRILSETMSAFGPPHENELNISSADALVEDIFSRGRSKGYLGEAPAARTCPGCGVEADPDQKFCRSCGQKLP